MTNQQQSKGATTTGKALRGQQVTQRLDHARTKEKAEKPVVRAKPKHKVNVGDYVEALILRGKSVEEVLADVQKRFPDARTQKASVYWYRSKLHREGKF